MLSKQAQVQAGKAGGMTRWRPEIAKFLTYRSDNSTKKVSKFDAGISGRQILEAIFFQGFIFGSLVDMSPISIFHTEFSRVNSVQLCGIMALGVSPCQLSPLAEFFVFS
jgi:hypothetical protein